jgi:hypothetical protein
MVHILRVEGKKERTDAATIQVHPLTKRCSERLAQRISGELREPEEHGSGLTCLKAEAENNASTGSVFFFLSTFRKVFTASPQEWCVKVSNEECFAKT